ncbi:MAG: type I DNA topoisomerase, partial [Acidobacteria bacterium]|nr:type I DNA topoisomerase [Acidobacteriota bacterium]
SKLGVDVEHGFIPEYQPIATRKKVIRELREAAKTASDVFIATDPDREGEAIGWHVAQELGGKKRKFHRLMFNEITRKGVLEAMKHPGDINTRMVDAQQARRVLDRLVGYTVSPLLWDKVRRGLSAGRVQSVALKLVCDREREIEQFKAEEYWNLFARLAGTVPPEFEAKLTRRGGETIRVRTEEESSRLVAALESLPFVVSAVATKERRRSAPPPFITSKLQQQARFPVKKTMMIAQQLYEGIELPGEGAVGLITYMRTDSTRVSEDALVEVRAQIAATYGADFVPDRPNYFRAKADAQDAHEAIRPTSMEYDPEAVKPYLTPDQYALYRLIWNRFVASQMAPAVFDDTTVDITAGEYLLRVKGSVPRFSGWLAAYGGAATDPVENGTGGGSPAAGETDEDGVSGVLPPLQEGQRLDLKGLRPEQRFTQPPPRYSEATLVRELEENGIGRPSTYASILGTLQDRDYVEKVQGRFRPTVLGVIVTDLIIPFFDDIFGVSYTAKMEEQLDDIEMGRIGYQDALASFYEKFRADLDRAEREMANLKEGIETSEVCDKCGAGMLKKIGRFGPFLACSRYPECTNTKELEPENGVAATPEGLEVCENCGRPMVVKRGRFGQFLACSGYPECKTTRKLISTKQGLTAARPDQLLDDTCPQCGARLVRKHGRFGEFVACSSYPACKYVQLKKTGVMCPKDGGEVVERRSRRGKVFFGCGNYPACDFTLWSRPVAERCPDCGSTYLVEKTTKRHGRQIVCNNDDCSYARSEESVTA